MVAGNRFSSQTKLDTWTGFTHMSETSKMNKGIYEKPIANITFNRENLNVFPPRSGIRQGCILLRLLLKMYWRF